MEDDDLVTDLTVGELREVLAQAFLEAGSRLIFSRPVVILAGVIGVVFVLWLVTLIQAA